MKYFRIKNYERYQSKKADRNTLPWIKLHKKIMNDWGYGELRVSERLMFIHMLLMADSVSNRFPVDPQWMRTRLQVEAQWIFANFESKGLIEIIGQQGKTENVSRREDINLNNINLKEKRESRLAEKTKEQIQSNLTKSVIEYLNSKLGTQFKSTGKEVNSHIHAREQEGYTLEQFKQVIDCQIEEWAGNSKMAQYLRPNTLFSPKFEGYYNASIVVKAKEAELLKDNPYD